MSNESVMKTGNRKETSDGVISGVGSRPLWVVTEKGEPHAFAHMAGYSEPAPQPCTRRTCSRVKLFIRASGLFASWNFAKSG